MAYACRKRQAAVILPHMEKGAEHWLTYRWQKGNRYYVAELTQDLLALGY
jgi:hypothetical protein